MDALVNKILAVQNGMFMSGIISLTSFVVSLVCVIYMITQYLPRKESQYERMQSAFISQLDGIRGDIDKWIRFIESQSNGRHERMVAGFDQIRVQLLKNETSQSDIAEALNVLSDALKTDLWKQLRERNEQKKPGEG